MALAAELMELTKHMAPDDAKSFENLLTKNPTLGEGWLRQADYDRKMNASKAELSAANEVSAKWKSWGEQNMPIHEQTIAAYQELEKHQKDLQEKLDAALAARAAAPGGDTVDAVELERRVKEEVGKLGYVSSADVDRIMAEQGGKLAREEAKKFIDEASQKFYAESVPAAIAFAMDTSEIAYQHLKEFDGEIDRNKFSEFMAERKILEPKKAYAEFVRPQREARETEKRVADAVKKKQDEMQQQYSAAGLPGGGIVPPGLQPKGAMQMRIDRDNEAAKGTMATSAAAMQAAQELRSEGRF